MMESTFKYPMKRRIKRTKEKLIVNLYSWFAGISHRIGIDRQANFLGRSVYITLTTIPARINTLHICIESLLRQSIRPTGIILWLYKEEFQNTNLISGSLKKQERRGLEIRYYHKGSWPHIKLIPTLREFGNATLITADDDIIYPRNWLASLLKAHLSSPNLIVCHRARLILFEKDDSPAPYNTWPLSESSLTQSSHKVLPTGVGGTLYPPNTLHPDVLDEATALKLCPKADDLWFKIMAVRNGTMCKAVQEIWTPFIQIPGSQNHSLWSTNKKPEGNDQQWKALLQYYGLSRLDFE